MKTSLRTVAQVVLFLASGSLALAQDSTAQAQVLALKASMAASEAILKQYEWVETTTITVDGEQKSQQLNRCYYGADGKVQKIPLTTPPPEEKKRGLRGLIAEKKEKELDDYMKSAVALVKQYVPPESVLIQQAKDAGNFSASPLPGQQARLTFTGYIKTGDSLAIVVDLSNNRPLSAKVSTFLDSAPDQPITLDVQFSTLNNNSTYTSSTALNATAKQLTVTVTNSGYRLSTN